MDPLIFGAVILLCLAIFGGLFQPPPEQQHVIVVRGDVDYNRGGCATLLAAGLLALLLVGLLDAH